MNHWLELGGHWVEADCAWPTRRVLVELDSWTHHGTRAAFERDRRRDRRARRAGWQPIRVTAWDLARGRDELEEQIAELLSLTTARRATP